MLLELHKKELASPHYKLIQNEVFHPQDHYPEKVQLKDGKMVNAKFILPKIIKKRTYS